MGDTVPEPTGKAITTAVEACPGPDDPSGKGRALGDG
jgi:hypothetical protein